MPLFSNKEKDDGKIRDKDGNIEHLFDEPLFDEDDDYIDELSMLDIIFGD